MALVIARELIPPSSIAVPFLGSVLPSFQPVDRQVLSRSTSGTGRARRSGPRCWTRWTPLRADSPSASTDTNTSPTMRTSIRGALSSASFTARAPSASGPEDAVDTRIDVEAAPRGAVAGIRAS
jgi:hypothetical protein